MHTLQIRTLNPITPRKSGSRPPHEVAYRRARGPMSCHRKERSTRRQFPSSDLSPPMSDSNLAQDFYTEFQATRNGLSDILSRDQARNPYLVTRLTHILDFTSRLSTATISHVSELSAQLAILRKQFVDARSFLPPYDQRQYEMVPVSLDALDVIIDDMPGIQATKVVGTSFGETPDESDLCWCQTKVCVQAEGQV